MFVASDRLLRQLFNSIKQPSDDERGRCLQDTVAGEVLLDATFDYEWLHEIGSGVDDCPLPHHLSSTVEISSLVEHVKSVITRLPQPSAITVARLCFNSNFSYNYNTTKFSMVPSTAVDSST